MYFSASGYFIVKNLARTKYFFGSFVHFSKRLQWEVGTPGILSIVPYTTMSSKMKVLITRPDFPSSALGLLKDYDLEIWQEESFMPRDVLLKKATGKNALIITPADKVNDELLDAAGPQLKVIATHTVGYDHVDFPAMKKRNVRLGITPGVLDDAVAELTIGVMLTCTRRLFEGRDIVLQGQWPRYQPLFWMNGVGLKNSVVGIVGMGRIGFEIAKRLVPFKVKEILYTSRREKPEAREVNGRKVDLNKLLRESDIVIVMCVLSPETKHLIGDAQFKLMKPTAILVNASRGDVLDQEALILALKNDTIAGAALDVMTPEPLPPDHELLKLKNCYRPVATTTRYNMAGKLKVLVTRCDLPPSALEILKSCDVEIWDELKPMPREIFLQKSAGKNALLVESGNKVDEELLKAAGPQLKVISTNSAGYDHVDFPALKKKKIRFGNTPGVLNDAVAELTIGVMLTCTRRLFEGRDIVLQGQWPRYQPLFWMNGVGLKNSVVGIVGMGRIGFETAKRLVPFKVKEILYTSRREKPEAREVKGRKVDLNQLLRESDIVIVMCVLSPETKHLLGDAQFKLMKPTAILVNASRGDVLDQEALVLALKNGTIAGAALDVMTPEPLPPDHELLKLKNCCIVPHLGSAVVSTRVAMAELAAANIVAALADKEMPAEVLQ